MAGVKSKIKTIKKILVATDFSPHSERALQYAIMLSKPLKADLLLVHVIESFTYTVTDTLNITDHYGALKTVAQSLLENARKKNQSKAPTLETELLAGTPHREILNKARRAKVDLIVMGSRGRTAMEQFLLGSVSEKVVRLSRIPVLTVHRP